MLNSDIYASAEMAQPSIRAIQTRMRASLISIEIAKAGLRPTLNSFAQANTRLSSIAQRASGDFRIVEQPIQFNGQDVLIGQRVPVFEKTPLLAQLTSNFGFALGLSLNVPLYSRKQNLNNIALAQLNVQGNRINLEIQKQALRQNIERAYLDLRSSFTAYVATQKQIESLDVALTTAQKQLSFGTGNVFDFNLAKTNLLRSQNELIRVKYEYLFRKKVLEFYEGKQLSLE